MTRPVYFVLSKVYLSQIFIRLSIWQWWVDVKSNIQYQVRCRVSYLTVDRSVDTFYYGLNRSIFWLVWNITFEHGLLWIARLRFKGRRGTMIGAAGVGLLFPIKIIKYFSIEICLGNYLHFYLWLTIVVNGSEKAHADFGWRRWRATVIDLSRRVWNT